MIDFSTLDTELASSLAASYTECTAGCDKTSQPAPSHMAPVCPATSYVSTAVSSQSQAADSHATQPDQPIVTSDIEAVVPSTSKQPPVAKRTGFFAKSTTSAKRTKLSETHKQFGAMAELKTSQLSEQTTILHAREDRDKLLHSLQVEKLLLAIAALQEHKRREEVAHELDMQIKLAKLKLLKMQLGEE